MVYAGTQYPTQGLIAFDAATGAIRWQRRDLTVFRQASAVTSTAVIVSSGQSPTPAPIQAVNPQTWATIWQANITGVIGGGDPVVANGVVYFGNRGIPNAVLALRLDTGAQLATLQLGNSTMGGVFDINPIITNGTLLASTLQYDQTGAVAGSTLRVFRPS
jgi:hypothetical protein